MKIGIIGAGFTALSAAYSLQKKGHFITLFEKEYLPGGLALGFKEKNWKWTLEEHYHHWFTSDNAVLDLTKAIQYPVVIKRPKTSVYVQKKIYQLDSPFHFLQFPLLSPTERLRMLSVLGALKLNPLWRPLEKIHAASFLSKTIGKKGYEMIWEPQLHNKFGNYSDEISLAWFWARIAKRTPALAYPEKGFLSFAQKLEQIITNNGGKFHYGVFIEHVLSENGKISIKGFPEQFDIVIATVPAFIFVKLFPQFPVSYKNSLLSLIGLGAINLILRLKTQFLKDNTYWLSICDKNSPIMALVEHTNFIDTSFYNNEHILYIGNYKDASDPIFSKSKEEMYELYKPYLQQINNSFEKYLIGLELFKAPFAQPIIPVNYSKNIPDFKTPLQNVYLANMQQVYPWDRGTNYAVELGQKVADVIMTNS